jgi:hypothetical protein
MVHIVLGPLTSRSKRYVFKYTYNGLYATQLHLILKHVIADILFIRTYMFQTFLALKLDLLIILNFTGFKNQSNQFGRLAKNMIFHKILICCVIFKGYGCPTKRLVK